MTKKTDLQFQNFPADGLVRVNQIVGDPKKGFKPFIPISKASWWAGVKSGKYPQPTKLRLGASITVWDATEIRAFVDELRDGNQQGV